MLSTAQLGSGLSPTSSAAQGSSQMHPEVLQGKTPKALWALLANGKKETCKKPLV